MLKSIKLGIKKTGRKLQRAVLETKYFHLEVIFYAHDSCKNNSIYVFIKSGVV